MSDVKIWYDLYGQFTETQDVKTFLRFYDKSKPLIYFVAYAYLKNKDLAINTTEEIYDALFKVPDEYHHGVEFEQFLLDMVKKYCLECLKSS